ncbi:hypothetical protein N7489_003124 [Penicillium chrysogenum]|uniref:NACHT-NTPase and P-loop NTPases N-terminal domain-containing protein n=1 Tax=Penicillium chrysogenum TaxID=5076 RepID=A0ABQ8W8J4_PENCH|nr:uncharacterized protein N7489_003124 [Penicillium chrysogenum]KAJ5252714.1 hypothetical protein N7489_003124 [Penicillium chrysogenum]KAJ5259948.1 hypothetical protein N7505_009329 [Penicillium chrysogenum]KAJ6142137.1 hypothetical protein N7497_011236 [Penicillium chrysogenum]
MAEQTTGLTNLFGGLSLTGETTELIGSASNCPRSTQQAMVEDIRTLIQSCEATLAHAQHIQTLVESTNTPSYQGIVELGSLRRRVTALAGITDTFTDATERSIIAYITSLIGPGTLVQKILSHFTNELSSITRDILNSTSDDNNVLQPYDPDFESEDYYEHKDRIAIDDSYTKAFRVRYKHQSKKKRQQREE